MTVTVEIAMSYCKSTKRLQLKQKIASKLMFEPEVFGSKCTALKKALGRWDFGGPQWFDARVIVPFLVKPLLRFQNEYMIKEGVKKTRNSRWFLLETGPLPKNCGPRAGTTRAVSIESVSLRRLVGVARGPIGCSRLKAGPDWWNFVLSTRN